MCLIWRFSCFLWLCLPVSLFNLLLFYLCLQVMRVHLSYIFMCVYLGHSLVFYGCVYLHLCLICYNNCFYPWLQVMSMLMKGNKERTQEPTAANKTSSRSHAVLQVLVRQRNRVRHTHQEVRTGKLFLIDLAGSERASNTQNRGKRMVEGAHINRSLLALGNCINALSKYSLLSSTITASYKDVFTNLSIHI